MTTFTPTMLDIKDLDLLISATTSANLLIYGEVHGIKENADIIYTLIHKLGIERLAVEASPSVASFINLASTDVFDTSDIDTSIFDSSIISLEVAKTLAVLIKEKKLLEIKYIDTYFDDLDPTTMDDIDSPQQREQNLADEILDLDDSLKTLCILGQWHTQPEIITLKGGFKMHKSALYRVRQMKVNVPFIHNIYYKGQLYNDGRTIDLPERTQVNIDYTITQLTAIDYDLNVPHATRISLPE